ncbi:metallophosphoesterase [Candidatus Daviesbacteria bacterium]|nr:metallophosphoesterase [Candidatus Daviesbacteria bacterium]
MFKKHNQGRRSPNILFVILRLVLSMVMLTILLVGVYSAYKSFTGVDPLKLDPQAVVSELLAGRIPPQLLGFFSSNKPTSGLADQINQKILGEQNSRQIPSENTKIPEPVTANLSFKFLLIADSHSDNLNLQKALEQVKSQFPDIEFIIGLGDYTTVGTKAELEKAKKVLDDAGIRYFLIPGDHDLWDCRNRELVPTECFKEVFGPSYQSFVFEGFKFLLLDNSDNYIGFDNSQRKWISEEIEKTKNEGTKGIFVFVHIPLYHPSSDHVMGRVEKSLKSQAKELMFELKEAGVKKVLAGDIHFFSEYKEPVTGLSMGTAGAITIERNPQAPRFAVASVFEDGSIKLEDIEIK